MACFLGPSTFNQTLKPKPRMVGHIGSAHCQMNSDNSQAASRFLPRTPKGSKLDPLEPYGKVYKDQWVHIGDLIFRSSQGSWYRVLDMSHCQY